MTKFQAGWEFIVALYDVIGLQRGVCVCVFVGPCNFVDVVTIGSGLSLLCWGVLTIHL